jgi:hypothetical protein
MGEFHPKPRLHRSLNMCGLRVKECVLTQIKLKTPDENVNSNIKTPIEIRYKHLHSNNTKKKNR